MSTLVGSIIFHRTGHDGFYLVGGVYGHANMVDTMTSTPMGTTIHQDNIVNTIMSTITVAHAIPEEAITPTQQVLSLRPTRWIP